MDEKDEWVLMVRGENPYYWSFHPDTSIGTAVAMLVERARALDGLHCEPMVGDVFDSAQVDIQNEAHRLYHAMMTGDREHLTSGVYSERVHNETTDITGEGHSIHRWGDDMNDAAERVGIEPDEFVRIEPDEFVRWVFETHHERIFVVCPWFTWFDNQSDPTGEHVWDALGYVEAESAAAAAQKMYFEGWRTAVCVTESAEIAPRAGTILAVEPK